MTAPQNLHLGADSRACLRDFEVASSVSGTNFAADLDPTHEMQINSPAIAIIPPISCSAAPMISSDPIEGKSVIVQLERLCDRFSVKKNPH
jgi:hypothetical protein